MLTQPMTRADASPDAGLETSLDAADTSVCATAWLACLAVAAALISVTVGMNRPIWADDANAQWMARQGFGGLIAALKHDNNFPVYYILLSFWMRIFGDSEVALRSLATAFYLVAGGATFLLGRAISGSTRVGLYAAVFYLGSTQAIAQAQSVRMYSMMGFLAALSLWLFWQVFIEQKRGRVGAYVAVNTLGALTQIWFWFVLLAQFAVLRRDRKKFALLVTVPAVVFGVLWGPVFREQLHNGSTHWLPPFQPWYVADALLEFYGFAGIGLFGVCAFFWQRSMRVVTTVLAVSLLAPLAVSVIKPIYYPGRYSIIALPALAVLLGSTLARFGSQRLGMALASFVLLASVGGHLRQSTAPNPEDDRATAAFIAQHAAGGDAVVFTSLTRATGDYYFQRLGAEKRFVEASFPAELDQHPGWRDDAAMLEHPEALEAEAERLAFYLRGKRVWLYYGYDAEVSGFLKRRLDAELRLEAAYPLSGPFHTQLLVYGQ